ncbi:MAG: hypothetical protein ACXWMF_09145, partial [Syntrophales bacterium]
MNRNPQYIGGISNHSQNKTAGLTRQEPQTQENLKNLLLIGNSIERGQKTMGRRKQKMQPEALVFWDDVSLLAELYKLATANVNKKIVRISSGPLALLR